MRVALDSGHGGHDPGATYGQLQEKQLTLAICILIQSRLKAMGHEVMMTRDRDVFVAISARAMLAKLWKADVFISVHTNADADDDMPGKTEAKGSEIWTWPGSEEGKTLAGCIAKKMLQYLPDRKWRGIKQEEFGVLRQTKAAALVEVGFIDTEESHQLNDPQTQIMVAKIISEGADLYARQTARVA